MGWVEEGWASVVDRWTRAHDTAGLVEGRPIRQSPATEAQIQELEARIGNRLPPSYRTFLLTTNGLNATVHPPDYPPIEAFLSTSRVHQLERSENHVWLYATDGFEALFDIEGNVAEQLLEVGEYFCCQGHMLYSIKVDGGYPESYMLLDPLDVDADGEWRAWDGHKEVCIKYRSFADLIEAWITRLEQPQQPAFYKHIVDPSPEAAERLALEAQLLVGGDAANKAVERLVEFIASDRAPGQRNPAMWVLLKSDHPAAQEAVLRLTETRPDDGLVIGLALQAGVARHHTPRMRAALFQALMSTHGESLARSMNRQWPELIDDVWHITGDPRWLPPLLNVGHPGSLDGSLEALANLNLDAKVRFDLCYTLGYVAGSLAKDPAQRIAIRRLADVPGNSRVDLARALLGCGDVDGALSIVGDSLEQQSATGQYLIMKLTELEPPAAVPVLIASLRRHPTAEVLHALGCFDHPDSAPELARHVDGALRTDALLALEQLGTEAALAILAYRAAQDDLQAARALARRRDDRALAPLLRQIDGPYHRGAVTGLRDLRHASTAKLLSRIALEDPDDNVAVIAAHGLVMAHRENARATIEALGRREDPHIRKLANHWLALLP
jgi:hypothetical protein